MCLQPPSQRPVMPNTGKQFDAAGKLLRQALETGFSQEELDRVKADFVTRLQARVRQADTRQTPDLARSLLTAVQTKNWVLSPVQAQKLLEPHVENLSLEAVNAAFQSSWDADHRLVLVTGNADIASGASMPPEERILKKFQNSARETADLFQPSDSVSFPYLPVPDTLADIQSLQGNVNDLGINQVDLDNGVRLNLKQTDFQKGRFLFKVAFGDGRACEPADKPGIAPISQQTLHQSGLGRMTLDQLSNALAGRDVTMEFSVEDTCLP